MRRRAATRGRTDGSHRRDATQTDGTARTTADVRLVRVTKSFGDTLAVDDISLTIEDGQFFSLLGPSGCGKTTTLSMIGGFEDPTAGPSTWAVWRSPASRPTGAT